MKSKNDDFKSELETQYSILIKTEKKEQRKRTILIFILLLLTFISSSLTTYYSYKKYKNTKETKTEKGETIKYYQTLETIFESSEDLNFDITTGSTTQEPLIFYVSNTGDTPIIYNINLSSIKTNLAINDNLKYSLKVNNEKPITSQLPLSNNTILDNITINPNEQNRYELSVSFNGYIDGSANYKSTIKIEQQKNVTNLIQ